MAVTETVERADTHGAGSHAHTHVSDAKYIQIALILGVITAAEVATYYVDLSSTALLLALMPMMVVKFGMVAWFFMHLRDDSRMFSRLFLTGIGLATLVYVIILFAFDEFF